MIFSHFKGTGCIIICVMGNLSNQEDRTQPDAQKYAYNKNIKYYNYERDLFTM